MTALTWPPKRHHLPPPKPWQRNAVFGTIGFTIALGWLGDALWASLVDRHPVVLIALNAKPRYLLLTVNEIEPVVFYVFATARLMVTKPLVWLVGAWYGPRAMLWAEERSHHGGRLIRWMERHFARLGWLIILITTNNVVCLLAGAAGFHLWWFLILAIVGTVVRLVVLDVAGDILSQPIDTFIEFVADHRPAVVAASVTLVAVGIWWQRRHGGSRLDDLASLEAATEDGPMDSTDAEKPTTEPAP